MKSCFISIISFIALLSALQFVLSGKYVEALVCLLVIFVAQKIDEQYVDAKLVSIKVYLQ